MYCINFFETVFGYRDQKQSFSLYKIEHGFQLFIISLPLILTLACGAKDSLSLPVGDALDLEVRNSNTKTDDHTLTDTNTGTDGDDDSDGDTNTGIHPASNTSEPECTMDPDPLPTEVIGDWCHAGVQGGIPNYPVGVNVKDYNAKGDGVTDDTRAILNAVRACPEGKAVFLPAGSYLTTKVISIRKSIVIRGAGPKQTTLIHNHGGTGIHVGLENKELFTGPEVNWVGIEDLHVQTRHPFTKSSGNKIQLNAVKNSWIRNVETSGYAYWAVALNATSHCEVRDSYIHTTYDYVDWEIPNGNHGDAYGIVLSGMVEGQLKKMAGSARRTFSEYNLVENNILDWHRHALLMMKQCKNNVFGYNFSWTNWSHTQSETHCLKYHHPNYDNPTEGRVTYALAEGNAFEMADANPAHGTNIYLRNWAMGGRMPGLTLQSDSYALGNQLTKNKHSSFGRNLMNASKERIYIHGNYVADQSGIQWDPNTRNHNIPNSYYLSKKPFWFGDLDWPPYGGPLMKAAKAKINTNRTPAQVRYWSMMNPENTPSGLDAKVSGRIVKLTWNNESAPGRKVDFIVCRSTDNVNFQRIIVTSKNSYTDTLEESGRYYYYVRARNFLGNNGTEVDRNDLGVGGESEPSMTLTIVAD